MSSIPHDLLSASSDSADAVWFRIMSWWSRNHHLQSNTPQSTLQLLMNPRLPPLLSPLPGIFRFIAFLIVAPIIFLCLVDFAGYAVFRTLGFNRRTVRVKAKGQVQKSNTKTGKRDSTAPVLTTGAYDADTLLRHRERSASAASAEAIEEWTRTGGQFARVRNVQAATKRAGSSTTVSGAGSPSESLEHSFGRVQGVGVEGALLGYFDTDAEDSGPESGQNSPEIGRRGSGPGSGSRRGLSGSALGFTPVSNDASKGLRLDVPITTASSVEAERSPKSNDSVTSSWIQLEESSNDGASSSISEAAARAAAAADLEPSVAT